MITFTLTLDEQDAKRLHDALLRVHIERARAADKLMRKANSTWRESDLLLRQRTDEEARVLDKALDALDDAIRGGGDG